jgi:BirA family biotin operon repressor/biotin-[acetyl-CoA-carboxylase] ligase
MQIVAHALKVLVVGIDTPRPQLDRESISKNLPRYWRVSVVEVTGSTQDDLFQLSSHPNPEIRVKSGEILVSEFQSKGRGRLDRSFSAAYGSALTFSLFYSPKRTREDWSFLTLLAGLSVVKALNSIDEKIKIEIKWPNDLLIGGKKVSGMLAQAHEYGVVIGIGINVGMQEDELPLPTATSLALENFSELDRNLLLTTIINQLSIELENWEDGSNILDEYLSHSATVGQEVAVTLPDGSVINADAVGITHQGELQLSDGSLISVGDVVHLR